MILAQTWKEDFSEFLKNYALYICLGVVATIVLTIVIIFLIKNRKPQEKKFSDDFNLWYEYLGGLENIEEITGVGSRLTVKLKDLNRLDEKIKELGVTNILKMSDKVVLVIENSASELAESLSKNLQK